MLNKLISIHFSFKLFNTLLFVFLFLSSNAAFSMFEDDIYNDPEIFEIFIQRPVLDKLSPKLKEELKKFTQKSAQKQHETLKDFYLIQDQLEKEYKKTKRTLTNRRLTKHGISCAVILAVPFLCISGLNLFLSEEAQIATSVPFIAMQSSSFFLFKFLELFSRKYLASWDGAIQNYELQYVRTKPLLDLDFCKVFEAKLIAAHKNTSNLYESLKWLNAAITCPLSKKRVFVNQFNLNFEKEFSKFPKDINKTIKHICLRHSIQQHTRVITYFHGSSGTGKTRCAREIAHCLELPFGSIALANYSVSDLIGQGGTHSPHIGKFAEAFLNAKDEEGKSYTNMVLLIDEADKILNSKNERGDSNGLLPFLLTFLDPETESYYNPYLEKNIRIKDALIILSGNEPLHNDSLQKRLINVKFSGFDKKYKKEYVINEYIPQLYQATEEPYKLNIRNHFSKNDQEKLSKFIDDDDDPGLRSIQEKTRQFVDEKIIEMFW